MARPQVCDADTVKSHPFLKSLLDHVEASGLEWRSALEYLPEGGGGYSFGAMGDPAGAKAAGNPAKGKKPDRMVCNLPTLSS